MAVHLTEPGKTPSGVMHGGGQAEIIHFIYITLISHMQPNVCAPVSLKEKLKTDIFRGKFNQQVHLCVSAKQTPAGL